MSGNEPAPVHPVTAHLADCLPSPEPSSGLLTREQRKRPLLTQHSWAHPSFPAGRPAAQDPALGRWHHDAQTFLGSSLGSELGIITVRGQCHVPAGPLYPRFGCTADSTQESWRRAKTSGCAGDKYVQSAGCRAAEHLMRVGSEVLAPRRRLPAGLLRIESDS